MAYIVLRPDHQKQWANKRDAFAQDLKAHAKKRLPGFACPEWVEVVQELPVSLFWVYKTYTYLTKLPQKTSTGKIVKTELRKRAAKL